MAPTVTKVHPNAGPAGGGTEVAIAGTNFTGATAVEFGSTSASFTVKTSRSINAVAPPGSGTEDITVTTPNGTSAISSADQFNYAPPGPTVNSLLPAQGPVAGGQKIHINGTQFTGATAVNFGATSATSFTVLSAKSIVAVDPVGTGTVDVTVTTPEGTSPISSADHFTYVGHPPGVSGVSPKKGPAAGGTSVKITGVNFIAASAVDFGSVSATSFTVNSATSITATSPVQTAGTVDVTVTTPYGTSEHEFCSKTHGCAVHDHFKFVELRITNLTPSGGSSAGGTSVTVTGNGFALGTTETTFKFGSAAATSVNCTSSTTCTVVAPAHAAGTVDVTAKVSGIEEITKKVPADRFTYS